jgi:hypothetical protein
MVPILCSYQPYIGGAYLRARQAMLGLRPDLIGQIKKGPLAGPELGGGFSTAVNERKENGGDARVHSSDLAPLSQVNWL